MKCEFFIKHSFFIVKKTVLTRCFWGMFVFLFIFSHLGYAQMFSVDDNNRPGIRGIPATAIYLGAEPASFDYQGPDDIPNSGEYEFNGTLIRFRLESYGINLFMASGGDITGIDDVSYFDAGLKAGYGITLLNNRRMMVQIPFQLVTSITSVVNRNVVGLNRQFQQGALIGGVGGYIGLRPVERIRLQFNVVPNYGFSFATGNTFGGSLLHVEGQARLFFDRVFGEMGLSLGYDYNYKNYNIEEDLFDYKLNTHSILVGITF